MAERVERIYSLPTHNRKWTDIGRLTKREITNDLFIIVKHIQKAQHKNALLLSTVIRMNNDAYRLKHVQ